MNDQEHAQAIHAAADRLAILMDAAKADGIDVDIRIERIDTSTWGSPRQTCLHHVIPTLRRVTDIHP